MEVTEKDFTVEHHAVLYALFVKQILLHDPERGEERVREATWRYGRERGERMAAEALKHGDPLTSAYYTIYGELPLSTGPSRSESCIDGPRYTTSVYGCGWLDAWEKYGLKEYGARYCDVIDESVYTGFNPELKLSVESRLSRGDGVCRFDWGEGIPEEEVRRCMERAAGLGNSFRKGFLFHTARILAVFGGYLEEIYGNAGCEMKEQAKEEFTRLFGMEFTRVLESA